MRRLALEAVWPQRWTAEWRSAGGEVACSAGRLHGFESLEERSLLLALDFTGTVEEVLQQPFVRA